MPGRGDGGERRGRSDIAVRRDLRAGHPPRVVAPKTLNLLLGGLLAEGHQLNAGHHGALNPAVAQA